MKKNQKNDEQYIKNPSEPDEKADELNENGPTSEKRTDSIIETGSIIASNGKYTIHCLTIIGQIEGHYILSSQNKTTKYEHVIPTIAEVEDNDEIDGLLVILNTVGGDVECGLAIAEMIASMSKPTVSLVLGGSHSIGVPLAVSTDYSFIVPTGTMVIHPVRMNGLFIGVPQTYDYFMRIQKRINQFVVNHCGITEHRFITLMTETEVLTKDVGSILVGKETVDKKIINEVGGLKEAMNKLKSMIDDKKI